VTPTLRGSRASVLLLATVVSITRFACPASAPDLDSRVQRATLSDSGTLIPPSAGRVATFGDQPFDQQQALATLARQIAGSENKPAREVFKNVLLNQFQGMPAGRLPVVMTAFSRALGTDCTLCHEPGAWEKEDKPEKQIARDMFKMVLAINNDYLQNIKHLKSADPRVSCTTCHRGQLKPEVNLPEPRPGANQ
jgi:hypothetical protein